MTEVTEASEKVHHKHSEAKDEAATEGKEIKELTAGEADGEVMEEGDVVEEEEEEEQDITEEDVEGLEESELLPSLEHSNIEEVGAEQLVSGLRRRNRPE